MLARLLCILSFALTFSGCANYGSEQHFERSSDAVRSAKMVADRTDRATVYVFRERVPLQELVYVPVAPNFYAVDGQMLAIMPLGSYVILSLEPGRHIFSRITVDGGGIVPIQSAKSDVAVDLAAGQSYFVGYKNGTLSVRSSFGPVDPAIGRRIVEASEMARFIHQPVSTATFLQRLDESERRRKGGSAPQGSPAGMPTGLRDALPSPKQADEFLEVIATVALVAVLLIGAAVGVDSVPVAPSTNLPNLAPPPAVRAPAPSPSSALAPTWRTSSGSLAEVLRSKDETILHNLSTGVRYRIQDGRIAGTDGSRYRVSGATVFSDSGQAYQVVGNNIFASDGKSCVRTGVVVTCR